ncbi:MAG: hypothetical protein IJK90_05035 [Bacteroidales bacterium]|nr:hypothetical protein [Bacteroidales bacterium]
MRRPIRIFLLLMLALTAGWPCFGQKKAEKDSLFRLVQAERAEQYEEFGMHYRLVKGHARFLHNDTYLLCDSASWNVDVRFIEAYGNVQMIQNKTMLKSERMVYWIDENRAQFSGDLVELLDKEGNTLRTNRLVYNTKDSLAVFDNGASLKDRDGNVIESREGTYDGKQGLFTFRDNVQMYLDSIEIKTSLLDYFRDEERAYFGADTYVWRGDGFLRADSGSYDRAAKIIHYTDHVFMFNPDYDAWADEVYYDQTNGAADLYNNAQVLDTTNKSIYLGDHLQYFPPTDSLSARGMLTGDPAIIYFGENEDHVVDTLYSRADTFFVYAVPRCDIPQTEVAEAEKRVADITFDALTKKRQEEAESREQERIKKMREAGKLPPEWIEKQKQAEADSLAALAAQDSLAAPAESLAAPSDSLAAPLDSLAPPQDSLQAPLDSVAAPPELDSLAVAPRDTTPIRYVLAWNNVKVYRSDIQAACDSMVFSELDSIARLYGSPVLWNEVRNQLTADEMQLLMKGGELQRGSMLTNAWMISERDTAHYNQIRSTEMLGYFRDNKIYRYDALGGVSAIFYMADEDVITTINVKEAKSMTAALKDSQAQKVIYFESIKSDVYPVGELPAEKQRLKGFKWRGDERPVSREVITTREIRESERQQYEGIQKPLYLETNKYYDNYMFELFERQDSLKRAELARRQAEQDSILRAEIAADMRPEIPIGEDEPLVAPDTVAVAPVVPVVPPAADSTAVDSLALAVEMPSDTAAVAKPVERVLLPEEDRVRSRRKVDETEEAVAPASPETVIHKEELTRAEKRALRRAERIAKREARKAERAARRAAKKAAREAARIARKAAIVE